jgi:hypothetical protein
MRNIIGLVVGFYLSAALVVFACAAWTFSTDARWQGAACGAPSDLRIPARLNDAPALDGAPNWIPWAAYRAITWPKAYFDDAAKFPPGDLVAWLTVQYNPFPENCG